MVYFILIALVSIIVLETINYIEHYGLKRKEIAPGVYEKVIIKSMTFPYIYLIIIYEYVIFMINSEN